MGVTPFQATGTWPGMVSLPSESMPLSISRFPNRFPVGPCPPLHGPSVFPPKSFWGIWDLSDSLSSRIALSFQWVPGQAGLHGNELADSLAKTEQHSPLPMFPAHWPRSLQRLDTLANLFRDEIFLTTPSPDRSLRFPRRNWPFPVSSAVNCPDFAATVTAFSCPLTYAG